VHNWQRRLVERFEPDWARLYIALDPAGLLREDEVLRQLEARDFRVLPFEDPIRFRLIYEQDFRNRWDRGEVTAKLIVWTDQDTVRELPWDVVKQGHPVSILPEDIFPGWPPTIFQELDRRDWALLDGVKGPGPYTPPEMVHRYLLTHVWGLPLDTQFSPELIHWAISRIHVAERPMPEALLATLETWLSKAVDWPDIRLWLRDRDAWLRSLGAILSDPNSRRQFPFFQWLRAGAVDTESSRLESYTREITALLEKSEAMTATDWVDKALAVGYLRQAVVRGTVDPSVLATWDQAFDQWIYQRYGLLLSLPYWPDPVMVHHVLPWIRMKGWEKTALIVLDGLSEVEWTLIRAHLIRQRLRPSRERAIFAWVPTLTSISRQSLLSGRIPRELGDRIQSTAAEGRLFTQFWQHQGILADRIVYRKHITAADIPELLTKVLPKAQVAALIMNTVDDLVHGAQLGLSQVLSDVELWLNQGWFIQLIQGLRDLHYHIVLTSDHGHVEVTGIGVVKDRGWAVTRGERARIFDRSSLKEWVGIPSTTAREWPFLTGLPDACFPVLATGQGAFMAPGTLGVSHGGAHFDEVVVPFVVWEG